MSPEASLSLAPSLIAASAAVVVAVLGALLGAYLTQRREADHWYWQKRVEVAEDALKTARALLHDASAQEPLPDWEDSRPLPDASDDIDDRTARLGIYGSQRMRGQWVEFVKKWEDHTKIGSSRYAEGDGVRLLALARSTEDDLRDIYGRLLVTAQIDSSRRPDRLKRGSRPTRSEISLSQWGPDRLRVGGALFADKNGASVDVRCPGTGSRVVVGTT